MSDLPAISGSVLEVSSVPKSVSDASTVVSLTSSVTAPCSVDSTLSKRAQKGKKNPPGSRNQKRKEAKLRLQAAADRTQAVADRAIVRVADLSSTLTATNRDLTDAVAARDKAAGKAKEWEHKYHITKEAADRERFKRTKDRLRHFQRVQNLSGYSATPPSDEEGSPALPDPSSLLPAPYPVDSSWKSP